MLNQDPVFCIMAYPLMVVSGTEFAKMFIDGRPWPLWGFLLMRPEEFLG